MPTSQETYRQLQSEIVRMFPELGELGFGCEVTGSSEVWRVLDVTHYKLNETDLVTCQSIDRPDITTNLDSRRLEVLGPALQLAHVLRALGKKNDDWLYWISHDGDLSREDVADDMGLQDLKINLPLHLPVSEWPEETLQKILDLMIKYEVIDQDGKDD